MEILQYKLRLLIDLTRSSGHERALAGTAFDIRIGDGGANGIRIRIFMANDKCFFFLHDSLPLISGC